MLSRLVVALERVLFGHRAVVLGALGVVTVLMAVFALQLRIEAGFEKQMPIGHEYIETFNKYRSDLFGANRITVVVKARQGNIWSKEALSRLFEVTRAVTFLPNVDRPGVQSLWTTNSMVNEITEEGFRANPLIEGTIVAENLTPATIAQIQTSTSQGGFVGKLVSRDQTSAMVTAEINEVDLEGKKVDYIAYNRLLEEHIRDKFQDDKYEIQIIGFAKQIGDIADGAASVLEFFGAALALTILAVYWYCRSKRFTILPIACSMTSLVWQFGTLKLLGYGLDPLAVLVPFLVFAIGVSHGIQQINFIVRELAHGKSTMQAARLSFTGLLIPGTLALVTAFVSFVTLALIPIPMVRELAVTASIGVGYKIITNLIMLPVAASFCNFSAAYAKNAMVTRERRALWMMSLAKVARPKNAVAVVAATMVLLAVSAWQSRDRVVGTLLPGAPELRLDSRFNQDALDIARNYATGLDWLTVVFEGPANACDYPALGELQNQFVWEMEEVPGVASVSSYSNQIKTFNQGYNEGNPKMAVMPIDPTNYGGLSLEVARLPGLAKKDCTMSAVHFFLTDHKASTINGLIAEVKRFRETNQLAGVSIRLASGNAGVLAAINDELTISELPMMLYVYAAIAILVLLTYRDLRAVIACCLPLTVGTFIGYWFMKELDIGLTVATLPVMVLAVGIGVDYAFYIYNRIQFHLASGQPIVKAVEHSILEVGMATVFTAITLAIGVATWAFSPLKFQADMGKLLAFMFMINLVMALTALPALVVVLEKLFPRRGSVRMPGFAH